MNKIGLVGGTYYAFAASGFMAMIAGAVMPYMIDDYSLSYNVAGIYLSLMAVGNLLSSYCVHWFIDTLGKKTSIVILSPLVTLGYFTLTLTQVAVLLGICFLLMGISRGSISNVNNSVINDYAPGESKYLNYLHMFFAVGAFLSPLVVMTLMGAGLTWKGVITCTLLISVSMFLVYCLLPIDNTVKGRKRDGEQTSGLIGTLVSDKGFLYGCTLLFFYVGAENAMVGWLVTYLKNSGIMSGNQGQFAFSLLWIAMIVGRFICAHLSSRFKNTSILLTGAVAALIMFSVFIFSTDPYILLAGVFGIGLSFAPAYPTTISVCGKVLRGNTKAMGTLLAVAGFGGVVVPYIVGHIADLYGIYVGMSSVIASVFFMVCFAVLLKKHADKVDIGEV